MERVSNIFVSLLMVAGLVMSIVFLVYSFNDLQQAVSSSNAASAEFISLP